VILDPAPTAFPRNPLPGPVPDSRDVAAATQGCQPWRATVLVWGPSGSAEVTHHACAF
jgi:hypothetical protein